MNIALKNKQIHIIRFRFGYADLDRNNQKPTFCKDCCTPLEMGRGVYRQATFGNGFVCFNCLRAQLLACTFDLSSQDRDAGFCFSIREHVIMQTPAGTKRELTTTEVLQAILLEWRYDALDALQGPDFINPQRLEDALNSSKVDTRLEKLPAPKPGVVISVPINLYPEYMRRHGYVPDGYNHPVLKVRKEEKHDT